MNKYLIAFLILLTSSQMLYAQSDIDWSSLKFKTDSTSNEIVYKITIKGGTVIYGVLDRISKGKLEVSTKGLGSQTIDIKDIDSIGLEGETSRRAMVGGYHYLISSSPYGVKKKEINIQSSEIVFISAWYGITDRISVSLGTVLSFDGDGLVVSFKSKYNYPISKKINVAVQYNQYFDGVYNLSYGSAMLGYGDIENNISVGYTKGLRLNGFDIFDYALNTMNISGVKRISKRFALLMDNYIANDIFTDTNILLYGIGARVMGRSSSFDFGVYGATGSDDGSDGFGLVWVNYTLKF